MKIRQITETKLHIKGTDYYGVGVNEKACIESIAKDHADTYKKKFFYNLAEKNGVETVNKTYYFADSIIRHFAGRTKEEAEQIAKDFFLGIPNNSEIAEMAEHENEG